MLNEPNLEKIVVGFATTTHASYSLDILDIETKGFELILINHEHKKKLKVLNLF